MSWVAVLRAHAQTYRTTAPGLHHRGCVQKSVGALPSLPTHAPVVDHATRALPSSVRHTFVLRKTSSFGTAGLEPVYLTCATIAITRPRPPPAHTLRTRAHASARVPRSRSRLDREPLPCHSKSSRFEGELEGQEEGQDECDYHRVAANGTIVKPCPRGTAASVAQDGVHSDHARDRVPGRHRDVILQKLWFQQRHPVRRLSQGTSCYKNWALRRSSTKLYDIRALDLRWDNLRLALLSGKRDLPRAAPGGRSFAVHD